MGRVTATFTTVKDLRQHVLGTLCAHDDLDPRYTPLHCSLLRKGSTPCGLFFQIQGPRMVRAYAVWSAEENRVLFYDGVGRRFAETVLTDGVPFAGADAATATSA